MGLQKACVNWMLILSIPLLVSQATGEYKVALRLDYGRVRGEGTTGKAPYSPWAPPPDLPATNLSLVCTKSEFPTQNAYCSFSHSDRNLTWTRLIMISKPSRGKEVFCAATFRLEDSLYEDGVQMANMVHNYTVCFSPDGKDFEMTRVRSLGHLLSVGHYRVIPPTDGQLFYMVDVKRVKMAGLAPEGCERYFSVHTEEDVDEARIGDNFIHFPAGYIFGLCPGVPSDEVEFQREGRA